MCPLFSYKHYFLLAWSSFLEACWFNLYFAWQWPMLGWQNFGNQEIRGKILSIRIRRICDSVQHIQSMSLSDVMEVALKILWSPAVLLYTYVICCGNMCCNTTEYVINTNNSMRPCQLLHVSPHHPKSLGWFQFCFFKKKLICCSF